MPEELACSSVAFSHARTIRVAQVPCPTNRVPRATVALQDMVNGFTSGSRSHMSGFSPSAAVEHKGRRGGAGAEPALFVVVGQVARAVFIPRRSSSEP